MAHPAIAIHAAPAPAPQPAQHVPLLMMRSAATMAINPALIHWQNPAFRPQVPAAGQLRTAFNLPTLVAPAAGPNDTMVFQAPRDASKRYFLPQYAIATAPGTGPKAQFVSLDSAGGGCQLTVHLTDATPASLAAGNAAIMPSSTRYLIIASLQGRAVTWDLTPAASPAGIALTLTLKVADFAGRDLLYSAMTDAGAQTALIIRRQIDVAWPAYPPPAAYARAVLAVDSRIAFNFSKDLDANVFAGLTGASGRLPGWTIASVTWQGRQHSYYQTASQPDQFYYLPDAFKVLRQTGVARSPALAVSAAGSDMASMVMTLSYHATAVWDPARITAAAAELQKSQGLPAPPKPGLFEATQTALFLDLPGADPAAGNALAEQKGALIDLGVGVQGSVTLGLPQFRQVYNALFDQLSTLLSGEVRVTVDTDTAAIPFTARLSDMSDNVFDSSVSLDAQDGCFVLKLTNAIESPIHIDGLGGIILKDGQPVATEIIGLSAAIPADLAPAKDGQPAGVLTVKLAPALPTATNGAGTPAGQPAAGGTAAPPVLDAHYVPQLDVRRVTVSPDPAAIWKALMVDQGAGSLSRAIALKCLAASLSETLKAVQVVFQSGQTANFDGSQQPDAGGFLNQAVKLSIPVEAFVLTNASVDTYTYRVDQIASTGVKKGDWVTDNTDVLYIVPG